MRNLIIGAGMIISGLVAPTANALPISAIPHAKALVVQQADYACGRGFHLSPRGYCRPNGPPRAYYDGWDRRDRWEARREWRERQERRAWRERRDWDRGYDYREYRWQ